MKASKVLSLSLTVIAVGSLVVSAAHSADFHDKAYYAHHLDEAEKRSIWCNHKILTTGSLSTSEITDCKAAEQAVHEDNFKEYVPGKGKPWSSAGGTK